MIPLYEIDRLQEQQEVRLDGGWNPSKSICVICTVHSQGEERGGERAEKNAVGGVEPPYATGHRENLFECVDCKAYGTIRRVPKEDTI